VNVDTLSNVAEAMRAVLTVKADELAKSSGLVKRSRKVTGSRLARTLVFGWLQTPRRRRRDWRGRASGTA